MPPSNRKRKNNSKISNRRKDPYLWREGAGKLAEAGPTGEIGAPETEDVEAIKNEEAEAEKREFAMRNLSDLNDPGDPEAGDVGLPGGAGSGGEMADGGSGGIETEPDDEGDLHRDSKSINIEETGAEENFPGDTKKERKKTKVK
ncbi:MAG: hypothetical protein KGJ13_05165 [Patescibacteria group bacterium]|nr:hypothetical protein [Patescibacteria group bacterium]